MKNKIILIGNSSSWISCLIIENIAKLAPKLNIEILAITDAGYSKNSTIKKYLYLLTQIIFNPFDDFFVPPRSNIFCLSSGIKVIRTSNINSKAFIQVMDDMKPDYAVVVGVAHIMKKELISKFKKILNYHNSYLPECGGLYATSWEMYKKYNRSGFSYHYIENERIDAGNVILQRKTKNDFGKSPHQNELAKTNHAIQFLEEALLLLIKKYDGKVQTEGSYYGMREIKAIRAIDSCDDIEEVNRRIHCFNYVIYRSEKITKLSNNGTVKRIMYLPVFIYRLIKFLNIIPINKM